MENLEIYNKLKSVPKEYLKTIKAGRLKWMTDIKPQWRIMKMTEVFWMCWVGWKISNIEYHYETFEKDTICNCRLNLFIKDWDNWSDAIPWTWWSRFSTMEKNWLYVSDEAEKMAYTDALSVAMKMIWVASDVYMWNTNTKYTNTWTWNSDDLPWYNNFEKHQEEMIKQIKGWKTANDIINNLTKKYKVNKAVRQSIKDLETNNK